MKKIKYYVQFIGVSGYLAIQVSESTDLKHHIDEKLSFLAWDADGDEMIINSNNIVFMTKAKSQL